MQTQIFPLPQAQVWHLAGLQEQMCAGALGAGAGSPQGSLPPFPEGSGQFLSACVFQALLS